MCLPSLQEPCSLAHSIELTSFTSTCESTISLTQPFLLFFHLFHVVLLFTSLKMGVLARLIGMAFREFDVLDGGVVMKVAKYNGDFCIWGVGACKPLLQHRKGGHATYTRGRPTFRFQKTEKRTRTNRSWHGALWRLRC